MIYYDRLVKSEAIKIQKTKNAFGKELEFIIQICNYFLILPFSVGKLCDDSDLNAVKLQDAFQCYIYDVPFKIRSIYKLLEIANYSDASILLRTLIESTIVYKFYISRNDGNGLADYILRKSHRTIKDIMEAVLPNYYDSVYASLCQHTHGNFITQTIFRANVASGDLTTNIENINSKWFYYISNQTLSIVPCILEMYDTVFPNNTMSDSFELTNSRKYIVSTITKFLDKSIDNDDKKETFYHYYKQLINLK